MYVYFFVILRDQIKIKRTNERNIGVSFIKLIKKS
jgi:hypothetical protein